MKQSLMKSMLAVILCLTMVTTACTADWIKIALADLPILIQMGINIATLIGGSKLTQHDIDGINAISVEAQKDLRLMQTLYDDYKASPTPDKLAKIQAVMAEINTNLPALLVAAHIKDAELSQRIGAAVGLILSTVQSFAQLMPSANNPKGMKVERNAQGKVALPSPEQLKKQWNQDVQQQF